MDTKSEGTKIIDEKFRLIAICPVCQKVFTNPKVLPCLHTFCKQCLQETELDSHQSCPLGVFCSMCSPHSGRTSDVKTNVFMQSIISKARILQPTLYMYGLLRKYSNGDLMKTPSPKCSIHANSRAGYYCMTCKATICNTCYRTEHRSHKTENVEKATEKLCEMIGTYWMAISAVHELHFLGTDIIFSRGHVISHSPPDTRRTSNTCSTPRGMQGGYSESCVNGRKTSVKGKSTPASDIYESQRRELLKVIDEHRERFYLTISMRFSYQAVKVLADKLVSLSKEWHTRLATKQSKSSRPILCSGHATPDSIGKRIQNSTRELPNGFRTKTVSKSDSTSKQVDKYNHTTDHNGRSRLKKISEEDLLELPRNMKTERQTWAEREHQYMTKIKSLQQDMQLKEQRSQEELLQLKNEQVSLNEDNKRLTKHNKDLRMIVDGLKREKQELGETVEALDLEIQELNESIVSRNRKIDRLRKKMDKHLHTENIKMNSHVRKKVSAPRQPEITEREDVENLALLLELRISELEKEVSELRKELEIAQDSLSSAKLNEQYMTSELEKEVRSRECIEVQYCEIVVEVEKLKHWLNSVGGLSRYENDIANLSVIDLAKAVQEKYDEWVVQKKVSVEAVDERTTKRKLMEAKEKEAKHTTLSKVDASRQCKKPLLEDESLQRANALIREIADDLEKLLAWIETINDPAKKSRPTITDERQFSNSLVQEIQQSLLRNFDERLRYEKNLLTRIYNAEKMANEFQRKVYEQPGQLKSLTEESRSSSLQSARLENSEHGKMIEVLDREPAVKEPQSVREKNEMKESESISGKTAKKTISAIRQTSTIANQRVCDSKKNDKTNRDYVRPMKREPTGIRNFGNTCYFSSVIQPLRQTELLTKELLDPRYKEQKTTHSDQVSLTEACRKFFSEGPGDSESVRNLLISCYKVLPEFGGGRQHDSHDLLVKFLDVLRQEERSTWKSTTSQETRKKSLTTVDTIFGGHVITVYKCSACKHLLTVCEPFLDLSVPIALPNFKNMSEKSYSDQEFIPRGERVSDVHPESIQSEDRRREACKAVTSPLGTRAEADNVISKGVFPLTGCLECFTQISEITDEYLCNNCTDINTVPLQLKSASRRTLIYDPPAVLVLHIKRFKYAHHGFEKCDSFVTYEELLDLAPYCSSQCLRFDPEEMNVWYSLYGVVVHMGTLSAGHYIAYVKVRDEDAFTNQQFLQETFLDRDKVLNDDDVERIVDQLRGTKRKKRVGRPVEVDGRWYRADDERVRIVDKQEALSQSAFLLFYERIPNKI